MKLPDDTKRLAARALFGTHTLGAAVAVVSSDNRIIMCQSRATLEWMLPGGFCARSQSPRTAAMAKFREKTGLAIDIDSADRPVVLIDESYRHVHFLWLLHRPSQYSLAGPQAKRVRTAEWLNLALMPANLRGGVQDQLAELGVPFSQTAGAHMSRFWTRFR